MPDTDPREELEDFLEAHPNTRYLEALMPGINGILRGKRMERADFGKLFSGGMNMGASNTTLDTRGYTFDTIPYGANDGDPDARAIAVPGSLAPVPWVGVPTAQVLIELLELDGSPHPRDPRNVLRRAAQPLRDMGLRPVMATELEFFLVRHDGDSYRPDKPRMPGSELPQHGMQFAMMEDLYEVDDFLTDLDALCTAQNIPAGAALAEFSPAQFEVNLHHVDDPVLACDHAVLLKRVVKAAAARNGRAATFMAKPFADASGNGMHLHVSLLDEEDNNVFAGDCPDGPFSERLRHAIGGLGATMAESMAIFAPNANSYRRYAPGSYVPASPTWGINHRGVAMRIPLSSPANRRLEHRVAGADCNPYLVVAAVLAGIHHGLSEGIEPGPMVPEGARIEYEVTVPVRWPLALDAFDAGNVLPHYLGEDYCELFSKCRREEEARYHAEVPDNDLEWYLRAV